MALRDTRKPALPTTPKLEFSAAKIGAMPTFTDVKSTEALSGGPALTARRTGRWLRRALRYPRLSAVGARWSDRHCIPFVRGPPLPVFQRLAGMRVVTRDRFLRPHGQGRRHSVRCELGRVAGEGLLRSALPHQLRRLRRTYAWIFVIQAIAYVRYPPDRAEHPCRRLGACRHRPDPRWPSCCCGSAIPWRMGGFFALLTYRIEIASRRERWSLIAMG